MVKTVFIALLFFVIIFFGCRHNYNATKENVPQNKSIDTSKGGLYDAIKMRHSQKELIGPVLQEKIGDTTINYHLLDTIKKKQLPKTIDIPIKDSSKIKRV
jgi:hypothetical protein